jgi:flagellum-specific ATP synthase
MRAAYTATAIAEHFRDQGRHVLLLMDSLTRFAQACREIGLAIGEPPTTRGYPPSVFARMPGLVERAGNGRDGEGSITAFYTVLTEGDDLQDPIADAARGILDGHIVLSRAIADAGLYPAIDIEASISRVMQDVVGDEHLHKARALRALFAAYQRNRDLINIGAYQRGADPKVDAALERWPRIEEFLKQPVREAAGFDDSRRRLDALLA